MIPNYYSRELQWLLKAPVLVALLSFAVGTILLLLFLNGLEKHPLMLIGLLYVILAFIANSALFIALVICSFTLKEYRKEFLRMATILLINIPIAVLYIYLVFNDGLVL